MDQKPIVREEVNADVSEESAEMKKDSSGSERKSKRKGRKRFWLTLFACSFILILAGIISFLLKFDKALTKEEKSVDNALTAVKNTKDSLDIIEEKFEESDMIDTMVYLNILTKFFDEYGYNGKTIEQAGTLLDNAGKVYYVRPSGDIIKMSDAPFLALDDKQLEQLYSTEKLITDDRRSFNCTTDIHGGHLIIEWSMDEIHDRIDYFRYSDVAGEDSVIVDSITGEILEVGFGSDINIDDTYYLWDKSLLGKANILTLVDSDTEESRLYLYGISKLDEDRNIIILIPLQKIISRYFSSRSYDIILILVFIVFCSFSAVKLTGESTSKKHIWKKYYLNGAATHVISLLIFCSILTIALSLQMNALDTYSIHNEDAIENLENLQFSMDVNDYYADLMQIYFDNCMTSRAEIINWIYANDPEMFERENLADIASALNVESFAVFDENGETQLTNTGYNGYSLSTNPEDVEAGAWSVLTDEATSYVGIAQDVDATGEILYTIAVRRVDNPGIVMIKLYDEMLSNVLDLLNVDSALRNADFDASVKIIVEKSGDNSGDGGTGNNGYLNTLFWMEPGADDILCKTNTLNSDAFTEGYAGIQTIDGKSYYLNIKEDEDYYLISAINRSDVIVEISEDIMFIILLLLVLGFVILIGTVFVRGESDNLEEDNDIQISVDIMNESLRSMHKHYFIISLLAILAMVYVLGQLFSDSLFNYLRNYHWAYGINIFCMTFVWLILLSALVITILLTKLINFVSGNLGPGALTVGHLMTSILKTVVWIVAVVLCLYRVGVNPGTMLAGAGITSVVVGIGAKDTMSDVIAGLFMVLEGHIRIGDWVTVEGFRGEVVSLGIRTTRIKLYGDVISINNSQMHNVINLSKEPSRIDLHFTVEYGSDISLIEKLINDNSERYMVECPELVRPPHFENLYDMAASGLELHIWCYCIEKDRTIVHNHVMRTTYEIMAENNITIPFTTITISDR